MISWWHEHVLKHRRIKFEALNLVRCYCGKPFPARKSERFTIEEIMSKSITIEVEDAVPAD